MTHLYSSVHGICVCIQRLRAEEEVEAYLEKVKESVSSIEGVLHRTTAPNLKALAKMREVNNKLQGVTEGMWFFTRLFPFKIHRLEYCNLCKMCFPVKTKFLTPHRVRVRFFSVVITLSCHVMTKVPGPGDGALFPLPPSLTQPLKPAPE